MAALVYIDNFDEVMDSIEEVKQSLLVAIVDRKVNKYFQQGCAGQKDRERQIFCRIQTAVSGKTGRR